MKKTFKILTLIAGIALASQSVFADGIDKFLDKYEAFIDKMEQAVKDKQYSKIEEFKKQHEKLMNEKDRVQESEGDFTVKQSFRIAGLNTRYGVAIGALGATKGTKKAADAIGEALEEDSSDSKKKSDKEKSKKA
ncbi:MAG: hypothetical protein KBT21_01580 [Treponema sp.]|nr:hypothetical protein [Candidatus Treponema merdequi]